MHEAWARWEGQVVDGKFPLRQYLGGSPRSAVFLTEYDRPEPRNAAIKLVAVDSGNTELQLFRWKLGAELSHPHLIRIFEMGRAQLSDSELGCSRLPARQRPRPRSSETREHHGRE